MKKTLMLVICFVTLSTTSRAQTCPVSSTLQSSMSTANAADSITLDGVTDVTMCPEISMTETLGGGKLIFSDSPESPTANSILYKDETLGATGSTYNRIFVYHVNSSGSTKRFSVILKNRGSSACVLTRQKTGLAGPTTSFLYAGKLAYNRWDTSSAGSGVSVPAGSWVELDTTFDSTNVANGNLYHGIWDYSFQCDHSVIICMKNTSGSGPTTVCPGFSVAARDSHVRGTFSYAEKVYDSSTGITIYTSSNIQQLPLAGGTTNDSYVTGWDEAVSTPTAETDVGNYGVLYKMHLNYVSDDGRSIGLCYNPRGGSWGGATFDMVGVTPTTGNNHFLLPPSTGSESLNTRCVVSGRYNVGAGTVTWAQFMPTGGSAFPLRIVSIPY